MYFTVTGDRSYLQTVSICLRCCDGGAVPEENCWHHVRLDLVAVGGELVHVEVLPIKGVVGSGDNGDVVLVHDSVVDHLFFDDVVERVQNSLLKLSAGSQEWRRQWSGTI